MDLTMYWFMFPVSICVATTAMLTGIGGAALFVPIFLIIFPLLGEQYVLETAVAAIGVGLLTETFGFTSGFIGYYRRRLIDFKIAKTFIVLAVPTALAGALIAHYVNGTLLKAMYASLMLVMAWVLLNESNEQAPVGTSGNEDEKNKDPNLREITAADGTVYRYRFAGKADRPNGTTSFGGFLCGMLGVGIGEVVMPNLVKKVGVPVGVAAGSSVTVVIVTVMSASFTHIAALMAEGGVNAVPWHLVMYTVPGVLIGGQIGPRLQGKISSKTMERGIATVFTVIGIAMFVIVFKELSAYF